MQVPQHRKNSFFSFLHELSMLAATYSSAFFIVFLAFYILAPQFIDNFRILGIVSACLFLLSSSSIVYAPLRQYIRVNVEVVGSIIFLIIFTHSYMIPSSSLAMQLDNYIRVLEIILNQGAIGFALLLTFLILTIPVLIKMFEWSLKGTIYVLNVLHIQNSSISAVSVVVALLVPLVLYWLVLQYIEVSNILPYGASVLMPILGFSLIYLHIKLLYKNFVGKSSQV